MKQHINLRALMTALLILFISVISGCFGNQDGQDSGLDEGIIVCPNYGRIVYESNKQIITTEEAKQLFLDYANQKSELLELMNRQSLENITFVNKNLPEGYREGWIFQDFQEFFIGKDGKIRNVTPCV